MENKDVQRLRHDFLRFATLHSWYKHIPLEGLDFWAWLAEGEQARNGIQSEVEDAHGLHWHFSIGEPIGVKSYKVRFGPFLRGVERGNFIRGFHIIVSDARLLHFEGWLSREYPQLAEKGYDWKSISYCSNHPDNLFLFQCEQEKYWHVLKNAVFAQNPK
jgi:hypothetical protein